MKCIKIHAGLSMIKFLFLLKPFCFVNFFELIIYFEGGGLARLIKLWYNGGNC